jgi:hypothetical protein
MASFLFKYSKKWLSFCTIGFRPVFSECQYMMLIGGSNFLNSALVFSSVASSQ